MVNPVVVIFIIPRCVVSVAMFDSIPSDVPAQYLSGAAAFVAAEGDYDGNLEKGDLAFILNEANGIARVPANDDGRANAQVVSKDSDGFDQSDALGPEEYSSNIFEAELEAWAESAVAEA